jgi:hypothetical protein
MEAAIQAAAAKAERDYRSLNPEARSIGVVRNIAAFKRRPKEFSGFRSRAVALFLSEPETVKLSNAAIAARLSEGIPGFTAPANLLTEGIRRSDKQRIGAMLQQRSICIDLARYNTPSKIKLALAAHYAGRTASEEFVGRVAFTVDAVIVEGKRFPIQRGKYQRIHAGNAMLNVDGLKALLIPD